MGLFDARYRSHRVPCQEGTVIPSAATSEPVERRANDAWAPLASSLFRWLWIASIASNIGTWMQNVGAAWLMIDLAPTALLVALVQTATNLPVFLLGVPAGAIADVVDRRKLLIVTQAWMLAAAAVLGFLTLAGWTGPWLLLSLTFALGLGATLNGPAWQAIVPELVPRNQIGAAVALNSIGFNLARALGPALGGLVVAGMGAGAAFILNAISFLAVIVVLYLWKRVPEHTSAHRETLGSATWAGIRYVRFAPELHSVLIRSGLFVLPASALWALVPVLAKAELHSESTGFGILLGCLGAGSILAALILARVRHLISLEVLVTGSVALFGLMNIALAALTEFSVVALAMIACGMAWMTVNSSLNTAAQTALPAWVRARALAVYLLVFQGAMALGGFVWGELAARFGLRQTLLVAGIALLLSAAATFRLRLSTAGDVDVTPAMYMPEPTLSVERPLDHGPVLVTVQYTIDLAMRTQFAGAMHAVERIRRRDGAIRWGLFEDAAIPGRFIESFVVESWAEHLRQHERMTVSDRAVVDIAWAYHVAGERPTVTHWIAAQ